MSPYETRTDTVSPDGSRAPIIKVGGVINPPTTESEHDAHQWSEDSIASEKGHVNTMADSGDRGLSLGLQKTAYS